MSNRKSGARTLLTSVLMSAPGPLILGFGLLAGEHLALCLAGGFARAEETLRRFKARSFGQLVAGVHHVRQPNGACRSQLLQHFILQIKDVAIRCHLLLTARPAHGGTAGNVHVRVPGMQVEGHRPPEKPHLKMKSEPLLPSFLERRDCVSVVNEGGELKIDSIGY